MDDFLRKLASPKKSHSRSLAASLRVVRRELQDRFLAEAHLHLTDALAAFERGEGFTITEDYTRLARLLSDLETEFSNDLSHLVRVAVQSARVVVRELTESEYAERYGPIGDPQYPDLGPQTDTYGREIQSRDI